MFFYTNHNYVEAPPYVHVDVSSDKLSNGMVFYTHHSNMNTPQYVHVDVYSDYLLN